MNWMNWAEETRGIVLYCIVWYGTVVMLVWWTAQTAPWIGLDWIGLDWIGLDWIGLEPPPYVHMWIIIIYVCKYSTVLTLVLGKNWCRPVPDR